MPESAYERARRHSESTGTVGNSGSSHHDQMSNLINHLEETFETSPEASADWDNMQKIRRHLNAATGSTSMSLKAHNAGDAKMATVHLNHATAQVMNAVHALKLGGAKIKGTPSLDASDISDGYNDLNFR